MPDQHVDNEEHELTNKQYRFLARLSLLLNSSLEVERVMAIALRHLKSEMQAEAATIYLGDQQSNSITFWNAEGGDEDRLEGRKMPSGKGVVGWVIQNIKSALVNDVEADQRFYADIDKEGAFKTRNMVCAPLVVKGNKLIGAVQVLNKLESDSFSARDLAFLEQFSHQLALSIEHAQLYQKVQEANKKLLRIDQRKSDMMTVINHEFKTPLNIIQTAADMLTCGIIDEAGAQRKVADTLLSGVRKLTDVVTEIRSLSAVSRAGLKPEKTAVSVLDLFQPLENIVAEASEIRSLTFAVEPVEDLIECDPGMISVVLSNLLSNAIRFTPDGGTVTVSANKQSGMVEIVIRDTGIGMDSAELAVVFEKFYEVIEANKHSSGRYEFKSGGLGLGLTSVKAILDAHGSEIGIESMPEKGTSVRFSLPAV